MEMHATPLSPKRSQSLLINGLLLVIGLIMGLGSMYVFMSQRKPAVSNIQTKKQDLLSPTVEISQSLLPTSPVTSSPVITQSASQFNWKILKYSNFTFEYPYGYHVAYFYPYTQLEGNLEYVDTIELSEQPIMTAPRGGGPEDMRVKIYRAKVNQDQEFQKLIDQNIKNENVKDVTQESIKTSLGDVIHYKGLVNFQAKWIPLEWYFLSYQPPNLDARNKILFMSEIRQGVKNAEVIRHFYESLKSAL